MQVLAFIALYTLISLIGWMWVGCHNDDMKNDILDMVILILTLPLTCVLILCCAVVCEVEEVINNRKRK